jgi:tRNA-Thr(GGU) m(6)t(6)A37 methyltransferase TsaA
MAGREVRCRPIGIIHTPFKTLEGMPIQPTGAAGIKGTIRLDSRFIPGLKDLRGFSHLVLVYHFHLSEGFRLRVKPFLDDRLRGVFATRAPRRPNPIGISVVRLLGVKGRTLRMENVDMVDGTPLLDIKPYVPEFDAVRAERTGWLSGRARKAGAVKADGRFVRAQGLPETSTGRRDRKGEKSTKEIRYG